MTTSNTLLLAITLFCVSTGYAQNVGIGTTTPGTKLTVAGGIASTPVSAAAAASVTIPSNASIFYLTAVSGSRTDALTMTSPTAGQYLTIYNLDGNPATFAGYTITASTGVMTFQYINGTWQAVSDNSFIGGSNYIRNQTGQQASSNFNISGNGVIGGTATVSSLSTAGVVVNSAAGLLGTTSLVATAYGGMGANMTAGAIGAIPYATSTTAYGSLAAVATGSYLRSAGTGTAPIWSTVTLPNAATTGDIWYASASNTMTALSDVAAGALLVSGGVGTAPSWISSTGTGVQGYWTRSGATLYNTNTGDNVGIGTSSPQARLHVITTGNQSGGSLAAWSGLEAVIGPGTASGSQPALGFAYDVANTVGTIYSLAPNVAWENLALRANTIAMYGSGSNLGLYVNASGYVGVGTASPVARLTVAGDGTGTAYIGGNFCGTNYTGISLNGLIGACGDYNMLSSPTDENLYINRPTGNSIRLRENNSDEVTIASGGYVGIGTTLPANLLDVEGGNIDASGYIQAGGTGGGSLIFSGTTAQNGGAVAGGASYYGRPRIGDWGDWLTIGEPNGTNGSTVIQVTGTGVYTGTSASLGATVAVRNTLDDGSGNIKLNGSTPIEFFQITGMGDNPTITTFGGSAFPVASWNPAVVGMQTGGSCGSGWSNTSCVVCNVPAINGFQYWWSDNGGNWQLHIDMNTANDGCNAVQVMFVRKEISSRTGYGF